MAHIQVHASLQAAKRTQSHEDAAELSYAVTDSRQHQSSPKMALMYRRDHDLNNGRP